MIKTVTLEGAIMGVLLVPETEYYAGARYVYIKNNTSSVIYASLDPDVSPGDIGTTHINSLEYARLELNGTDTVYIYGTGTVELYTSSSPVSPYSDEGSGSGGGGGTGTDDYNPLINHPHINDRELIGNKSFEDLGLKPITSAQIDALFD